MEEYFTWAGYVSAAIIFLIGFCVSAYWIGIVVKECVDLVVRPLSKIKQDIRHDVVLSTHRGEEFTMKKLIGFSGKRFFFWACCLRGI